MNLTPSDSPPDESRKRTFPDYSFESDSYSPPKMSRMETLAGLSQISPQQSFSMGFSRSSSFNPHGTSISQDCTDQFNRLHFDSQSQSQFNIRSLAPSQDVRTHKYSNDDSRDGINSISTKQPIFGALLTQKLRHDSCDKDTSDYDHNYCKTEKEIVVDEVTKNYFLPRQLVDSNHPFFSLLAYLPLKPSLPPDFYYNPNNKAQFFNPPPVSSTSFRPKMISKPLRYFSQPFSPIPYLLENFEDLNIFLGAGISSDVTVWRHRMTGMNYAIKRKNFIFQSSKTLKQISHEAGALAYLDHCLSSASSLDFFLRRKPGKALSLLEDSEVDQNQDDTLVSLPPSFVRYYNSWKSSSGIIIQMELCDLGSLEDFVAVYPSSFSIVRKSSIKNILPQESAWGTYIQKQKSAKPVKEVDPNATLEDINSNSNSKGSDQDFILNKKPNRFISLLDSEDSYHLYDVNQQSLLHHTDSLPYSLPVVNQSMHQMDESHLPFTNTQMEDKTNLNNNIFANFTEADRSISEKLAWFVLHSLSSSLAFLHFKNMAHLDVKPANIFLQTSLNSSFPVEHISEKDTPESTNLPQTSSLPTTKAFSLFEHVKSNNSLFTSDRTISNSSNEGSSLTQAYNAHRQAIEDAILTQKILLKLGDLSNSCPLDAATLDDFGHIEEGATNYLSPECIEQSTLLYLDFTKVDVYALGATVYELCLGRLLTTVDIEDHIRTNKPHPEIAQKYSDKFIKILQKCLSTDPTQRPSAIALRDFTRKYLSL